MECGFSEMKVQSLHSTLTLLGAPHLPFLAQVLSGVVVRAVSDKIKLLPLLVYFRKNVST